MKVDPSRASALISQLKNISERVATVANGRNVSHRLPMPYDFLATILLSVAAGAHGGGLEG